MLWLLLGCIVRSDIVDFTPDNLEGLLVSSTREDVLVMFYAKWCNHSRNVMPSVERAAELLTGSARLFRVDITNDVAVAERYNITGYPSLRLFRHNAASIDYEGSFASKAIAVWARRISASDYTSFISTENQVHDLRRFTPFVAIAYFPSSRYFGTDAFSELAKATLDMEFVWTNNTALAEKLSVPRSGLVLHSDEGRFIYSGDLDDLDTVDVFLRSHRLPLLTKASFENSRLILKDERNIILFQHTPPLLSEDHRHEWLFVALAGYQPLIDYVQPTADIMVVTGGLSNRSSIFECKDLSSCLKREWKRPESRISRHVNSRHAHVIELTTDSLAVASTDKPMLVFFYAPWCLACSEFHTILENHVLMRVGEKVSVARIDCSANDTPGIHVPYYPYFRLISKPGTPGLLYPGEFDKGDDLINWVLSRF